ncbi:hypothetical protein GCM10025862_14390 [Arsenicicoccus piscis]|uniref:ROK family protein n=1 Tax=Arsenicicoccus piscis TaxID=673954 RepID=A0ABQ6HP22_9MICO|nr:hypothetical protein GCM10025862_14390 [Arsenicicoccus piscis]
MSLNIGLDIGGTKIAGAVVDEHGHVVARGRRSTDRGAEAVASTCADLVRELAVHRQIAGVGMAVAGFVDATGSHVSYGTNLGLQDEPMKLRMESLIDYPVVLDNDANAAAWGEYRFGAGQGYDHILAITVGTGIGGGIIIGRRMLRGAYGFAAEIGHIRMVKNGPVRLRQQGLLGDVRERQRAAAGRQGAGRLRDTARGEASRDLRRRPRQAQGQVDHRAGQGG